MINRYACLSSNRYTLGKYSITALRHDDIFSIMDWRNEQIAVLRQQNILRREEQEHYYLTTIEPTFSQQHPNQILFSIFHQDILIGYGGFVHINWRDSRAEISFLSATERTRNIANYHTDFSHFLSIIKPIAFKELQLNRLSTETFDIRPHVISILEENGFQQEGVLRKHNFIDGKYIDSLLHCLLACQYPINEKNITDKLYSKNNIPVVLVTSISKKIPLLKAVKSDILECSSQGLLYGADSNVSCLGRHFVDDFVELPPDKELHIKDLLNMCKCKGINIIIPTRDAELHFFASHRSKLLQHGIHVMVSCLSTIENCLDKLKFSRFFNEDLQIKVIPSLKSLKDVDSEALVVKERYGSGSRSTHINLSKKDAGKISEQLRSPIFQPFIEGLEYSIDIYRDFSGNILGAITRKRDLIVNGESQITTIEDQEKLRQICMQACSLLDLHGHVVFQAIIDTQGTIHLLECNPRFGGASTLSIAAGLHSAKWFIQEHLLTPSHPSGLVIGREGMRLIRIPQDTFHTKQ